MQALWINKIPYIDIIYPSFVVICNPFAVLLVLFQVMCPFFEYYEGQKVFDYRKTN